MQINLFLTCQSCAARHQNYRTSKPKNSQVPKLNLRKYCRFCRQTQPHKEEIIKKT